MWFERRRLTEYDKTKRGMLEELWEAFRKETLGQNNRCEFDKTARDYIAEEWNKRIASRRPQ